MGKKNTVSIIGAGDTVDVEIEPSFDAVSAALNNAYVTPVRLSNGACMLVDEEGLLKNLPYNERAT